MIVAPIKMIANYQFDSSATCVFERGQKKKSPLFSKGGLSIKLIIDENFN